jgi:hypothetical protein
MTETKSCKHIVEINLPFMKKILALPNSQACRYATPFTQVDFVNAFTKKDLKDLANWIMTSGVANEIKSETKNEEIKKGEKPKL